MIFWRICVIFIMSDIMLYISLLIWGNNNFATLIVCHRQTMKMLLEEIIWSFDSCNKSIHPIMNWLLCRRSSYELFRKHKNSQNILQVPASERRKFARRLKCIHKELFKEIMRIFREVCPMQVLKCLPREYLKFYLQNLLCNENNGN